MLSFVAFDDQSGLQKRGSQMYGQDTCLGGSF
jgi:hypothetical protein